MANSVTIRTSVPGAKDAASQLGNLKQTILGMGTARGGVLGGMSAGFIGAGAAIGGAMVVAHQIAGVMEGVGEAIGSAAAAAMDDERSVRSLTTALEENVPKWDHNVAKIEEYTDSAIELGFADDDTRASIQKLVIATGDLNTAYGLNRLAMDIARGRNIDLASATDIVIKANMGNIGALRRMGIEVDKNATSTEILTELQKKYTGQAKTFADTTEGSMAVAAQQAGELQERIGYGVLPVFKDFIGYLNDGIESAGDLGDAFDRLLNPREGDWASLGGKKMVESLHEVETVVGQMPSVWGTLFAKPSGDPVDLMMRDIMGGVQDGAPAVGKAMDAMTREEIIQKLHDARQPAANQMEDLLADDLVGTIRSGRGEVQDAMGDLTFAMLHPLAGAKLQARIEGALTSRKMAEGLESNNPMIRHAAEQAQARLIALWEEITGQAYTAGTGVSSGVAQGIKDEKQAAINAAGALVGGVNSKMEGLKTNYNVNVNTGVNGGRGAFGNGKDKNDGGKTLNVNVSLSTRHARNQINHDKNIQGGYSGIGYGGQ